MKVYHIIPSKRSLQCREETGGHGRQTFFIQSENGNKPYPFIPLYLSGVEFFSTYVVSATIKAGNGMAQSSHPGGQFFHNNFYTALTGWNSFVA